MKTTTHPSLRFRLAEPAEPARLDRRPFLLALLFIAGLAAVRLLYLANDPPLQLAQDEAHYWDWSRHLDWSYYSKGPLVAWLIRLSCLACGGDTLFAIRLPAVVCGAITLLALFDLTNRTYGRPWLAVAAVALTAALPLFHVGALLMTIDAPYVAAWAVALALGQRLVSASHPPTAVGGRLAWCVLGLVVGLGILAKYTMVLFIPALALFCLLSKEQRGWFRRPEPYLMTAIAALCCLPILIWNFQNGWVTLRHVGGQAGLTAGEFGQPVGGILWLGPLDYLAGQFALLLGLGFLVWLAALGAPIKRLLQSAIRDPQSAIDPAASYLATMSLVPFLVFLAFSLKTKVQLNWPVAAYLAGLPLCVHWLAERWSSLGGWRGRLFRGGMALALLAGLALSVVIHQPEWLYPLMNRFAEKLPARRWDPTCRLRGWTTLAAALQAKHAELRGQGIEPILAGTVWNLPGEIGFHLPEQPPVFCLGELAGDRQSQYDFWPPHPAHQPEVFAGKTFLIVGWAPKSLWRHFERVEKTQIVTHEAGGQVAATWAITVAHGFRRQPGEPRP